MDRHLETGRFGGFVGVWAMSSLLLASCTGQVEREVSTDPSVQALSAGSSARMLPAEARHGGKSLTEWLGLYSIWMMTGEPESGGVGHTMFLPMPQGDVVSEDPLTFAGHMDLDVAAGTALLVPCLGYAGETYDSGASDEPLTQDSFDCHDVTLDGRSLDMNGYYVFDEFDPPIAYAEPTGYGSIAMIFFQSVGFIVAPMSAGEHTLAVAGTLHLGPDFSVSFENTWNLTVSAH